MYALIRIEWLKIKKYPAFWWLFGIVLLGYPCANGLIAYINNEVTREKQAAGQIVRQYIGNPFSFPEVWHSVAFFSSLFLLLPAILVIMLICNEYSYKTNRQNVIDGWSRDQFIWSKLIDVVLVALIATITYFVVSLSFGLANSSAIEMHRWDEQLYYIPLFFLQTFSQLSIAFLLGFLLKRSFIALAVFIFYYALVDPIAAAYIKYKLELPKVARLMPMEMSDLLIPYPAFMRNLDKDKYEGLLAGIGNQAIYTSIFTAGIWFLCFYLYKKRDI
jgi:ABC-type transport system involved in multi-copper enzyme maturation permease subunit